MRLLKSMPAPVALAAWLVAADMALFTMLRAAFYLYFDAPADPVAEADLARAFLIGLRFDLRLALLINAPLLLAGLLRARRGWIVPLYAAIAHLGVMLFYVFDFGYYAYLGVRLDSTSLRFLQNFAISAGMIWQTYPVMTILALVIALFALSYFAASRLSRRLLLAGTPAMGGARKALWSVAVLTVVLGGIYGKLSLYPLRWSDAFFSPHPFVSALALNPVTYFFETMATRSEEPYDEQKLRDHYGLLSRYLGLDSPDAGKLDFTRARAPQGEISGRPNIVIVLLESFAFYKTGVMGNPLMPTPNFDRIAEGSVFFTRFYVPRPGTARSVFATITGIPDVARQETYSRNPLVVDQHTIINDFKEYEKLYFLGGSLNWANIRGLVSHNIEGIEVYEEGSFKSAPVDVWGISDLHLFEEASGMLASKGEPFLAIIQTSGNHRPYTIPKDSRGFQPLTGLDQNTLLGSGFISIEEFNAFRFMDHAIGHFMNVASKEEYFNNTVFVFLGDHGLPGYSQSMLRSEEQLGLTHFHVPLAVYAPGRLAPKVINAPVSQADLLPTVAAMTSTPYTTSTIGRDALDPAYDGMRYAFTISEQATMPEIGLMGESLYFRMKADGSDKALHDYYSEGPREDVTPRHPDEAAFMEELTWAIYEASRYMPYHNKKRRSTPAP